jgi:hypothetical protein
MRERLRALLCELEDINHFVQQGCVDPHHLACFDGYDNEDHEKLMAESDRLTGSAYSAIEELMDMMKESK